jgi:cytochrome c oxidase assembly factor CtaG
VVATGAPAASQLAGAWGGDPGVLVLLFLVAGLYLRGARRRPTTHHRVALHDLAFAGGLVAIVAALASPLDAVAPYLLWAHMAQHVVLVQVAAPLLVIAAPLATIEHGLPRSLQRAARSLADRRVVRSIDRVLRSPFAAFALLAGAWWAWHVPALYDAAVEHAALHAAEHLTLLATGVCWWACIVGPRRLAPLPALALAFTTAFHLNVLGALLTFAPRVLYAPYSGAYGFTALEDQQLGGVLMWSIGGFVSLAIVVSLLYDLLRDDVSVAVT